MTLSESLAPAIARRPSLAWASLCLAVATLIAIWAGTWQRTEAERHLLETNALSQQRSVAVILSENLSQVTDRGRLMALAAESWFDDRRAGTGEHIAQLLATDQVFLRVALYDSQLALQFQTSPRCLKVAPPPPCKTRWHA